MADILIRKKDKRNQIKKKTDTYCSIRDRKKQNFVKKSWWQKDRTFKSHWNNSENIILRTSLKRNEFYS